MKELHLYLDRPPFVDNRRHSISKTNKNRNAPPLKRDNNAWKPGASSLSPKERLLLDVTDILNKLTPEKYARLLDRFINLPDVGKEENIPMVVECIQNKAFTEPKYSNMYAKLCKGITKSKLIKSEFKKILLLSEQNSFNKGEEEPEDDEAIEGKSP